MKPGLYVATVYEQSVVIFGPDSNGGWRWIGGRDGEFQGCSDGLVADARPLVVLDPESVTDVDALTKALVEGLYAGGQHSLATQGIHVDYVRDALRALAAPAPAEPMGLGAVVKDSRGVRWVRCSDGEPEWKERPWYRVDLDPAQGKWATWTEIEGPEVTA